MADGIEPGQLNLRPPRVSCSARSPSRHTPPVTNSNSGSSTFNAARREIYQILGESDWDHPFA